MADLSQIDSKITEIKIMLEKHIATSELEAIQFKEKLGEHSGSLWGKNGSPGLEKDVDRLKSQAGALKWMAGIVGTVLIERIYSWFSGKHP